MYIHCFVPTYGAFSGTDRSLLLKNVYASLAPKGVFVVDAFTPQHVEGKYIVATSEKLECYNLWEQAFTTSRLQEELRAAGFDAIDLFGDIIGTDYSPTSNTICAVARK